MVNIPNLFRDTGPSLDAEALFRPIHLGLERKRQRQLDQERRDDKAFARSLKEREEVRAQTAFDREGELYEKKKKKLDIELLMMTNPELLKTEAPGAYEQYKQKLEKGKLSIEQTRAYINQMKAYAKKAEAMAKRYEASIGQVEKRQRLTADTRQIGTNIRRYVNNLKSAGAIDDNGYALLQPQTDQNGSPILDREYYLGIKDKIVSVLKPEHQLSDKHREQLFNLHDDITIWNQAFSAVTGADSGISQIEDETRMTLPSYNRPAIFDQVAAKVRKVLGSDKPGFSAAAVKTWSKMYGNRYGDPKELIMRYIEGGTVPSSMEGDTRERFAARAMLQRLSRNVATWMEDDVRLKDIDLFQGGKLK